MSIHDDKHSDITEADELQLTIRLLIDITILQSQINETLINRVQTLELELGKKANKP